MTIGFENLRGGHGPLGPRNYAYGPGFSGRAGFELKLVEMFQACIKFFFPTTVILSPLTVETIELIKSSIKNA